MVKAINKPKIIKRLKKNTTRRAKIGQVRPQKKGKTQRISEQNSKIVSAGKKKKREQRLRVNNDKIKKTKIKRKVKNITHRAKTRQTQHHKKNSTRRINRRRGGAGAGEEGKENELVNPAAVQAAAAEAAQAAAAPSLYQLYRGEPALGFGSAQLYNDFWYDTIHDRINPFYNFTKSDDDFLRTPRFSVNTAGTAEDDKKTLKELFEGHYEIVDERKQLLPLSDSIGKVRDAGYPGPAFPPLFAVLDGAPSSAANHYAKLKNPPESPEEPGIGVELKFNGLQNGMCKPGEEEPYYFETFMYQLDMLLFKYYSNQDGVEVKWGFDPGELGADHPYKPITYFKDGNGHKPLFARVTNNQNELDNTQKGPKPFYHYCHLIIFNKFWKGLLKEILDEQKRVFIYLLKQKPTSGFDDAKVPNIMAANVDSSITEFNDSTLKDVYGYSYEEFRMACKILSDIQFTRFGLVDKKSQPKNYQHFYKNVYFQVGDDEYPFIPIQKIFADCLKKEFPNNLGNNVEPRKGSYDEDMRRCQIGLTKHFYENTSSEPGAQDNAVAKTITNSKYCYYSLPKFLGDTSHLFFMKEVKDALLWLRETAQPDERNKIDKIIGNLALYLEERPLLTRGFLQEKTLHCRTLAEFSKDTKGRSDKLIKALPGQAYKFTHDEPEDVYIRNLETTKKNIEKLIELIKKNPSTDEDKDIEKLKKVSQKLKIMDDLAANISYITYQVATDGKEEELSLNTMINKFRNIILTFESAVVRINAALGEEAAMAGRDSPYVESYKVITEKFNRINVVDKDSTYEVITIELSNYLDFALSVASFIDRVDGKYNNIIIHATELSNKINEAIAYLMNIGIDAYKKKEENTDFFVSDDSNDKVNTNRGVVQKIIFSVQKIFKLLDLEQDDDNNPFIICLNQLNMYLSIIKLIQKGPFDKTQQPYFGQKELDKNINKSQINTLTLYYELAEKLKTVNIFVKLSEINNSMPILFEKKGGRSRNLIKALCKGLKGLCGSIFKPGIERINDIYFVIELLDKINYFINDIKRQDVSVDNFDFDELKKRVYKHNIEKVLSGMFEENQNDDKKKLFDVKKLEVLNGEIFDQRSDSRESVSVSKDKKIEEVEITNIGINDLVAWVEETLTASNPNMKGPKIDRDANSIVAYLRKYHEFFKRYTEVESGVLSESFAGGAAMRGGSSQEDTAMSLGLNDEDENIKIIRSVVYKNQNKVETSVENILKSGGNIQEEEWLQRILDEYNSMITLPTVIPTNATAPDPTTLDYDQYLKYFSLIIAENYLKNKPGSGSELVIITNKKTQIEQALSITDQVATENLTRSFASKSKYEEKLKKIDEKNDITYNVQDTIKEVAYMLHRDHDNKFMVDVITDDKYNAIDSILNIQDTPKQLENLIVFLLSNVSPPTTESQKDAIYQLIDDHIPIGYESFSDLMNCLISLKYCVNEYFCDDCIDNGGGGGGDDNGAGYGVGDGDDNGSVGDDNGSAGVGVGDGDDNGSGGGNEYKMPVVTQPSQGDSENDMAMEEDPNEDPKKQSGGMNAPKSPGVMNAPQSPARLPAQARQVTPGSRTPVRLSTFRLPKGLSYYRFSPAKEPQVDGTHHYPVLIKKIFPEQRILEKEKENLLEQNPGLFSEFEKLLFSTNKEDYLITEELAIKAENLEKIEKIEKLVKKIEENAESAKAAAREVALLLQVDEDHAQAAEAIAQRSAEYYQDIEELKELVKVGVEARNMLNSILVSGDDSVEINDDQMAEDQSPENEVLIKQQKIQVILQVAMYLLSANDDTFKAISDNLREIVEAQKKADADADAEAQAQVNLDEVSKQLLLLEEILGEKVNKINEKITSSEVQELANSSNEQVQNAKKVLESTLLNVINNDLSYAKTVTEEAEAKAGQQMKQEEVREVAKNALIVKTTYKTLRIQLRRVVALNPSIDVNEMTVQATELMNRVKSAASVAAVREAAEEPAPAPATSAAAEQPRRTRGLENNEIEKDSSERRAYKRAR